MNHWYDNMYMYIKYLKSQERAMRNIEKSVDGFNEKKKERKTNSLTNQIKFAANT